MQKADNDDDVDDVANKEDSEGEVDSDKNNDGAAAAADDDDDLEAIFN